MLKRIFTDWKDMLDSVYVRDMYIRDMYVRDMYVRDMYVREDIF